VERVLYLHGFASGPQSKKARLFSAWIPGLEVPDLVDAPFRDLTLSSQLAVMERTARGEPVSLIGSSLGGYLAALYAARHPEVVRLVLLAPAFGFADLYANSLGPERLQGWQKTGVTRVMHYGLGGETELGWQLMEDARRYEAQPDVRQPTLIVHGIGDEVVPTDVSIDYAASRPNVRLDLVESDHELLDVFEFVYRSALEHLVTPL
jgi:uncharacterized protein